MIFERQDFENFKLVKQNFNEIILNSWKKVKLFQKSQTLLKIPQIQNIKKIIFKNFLNDFLKGNIWQEKSFF